MQLLNRVPVQLLHVSSTATLEVQHNYFCNAVTVYKRSSKGDKSEMKLPNPISLHRFYLSDMFFNLSLTTI